MSKTPKIEVFDFDVVYAEPFYRMILCKFEFGDVRYACAEYFTVDDGEVTVDDTADSHMRVTGIYNAAKGSMEPFVENGMDRDDYEIWSSIERQVRDGMQARIEQNVKFQTSWLSQGGQGSLPGEIFDTIDDAQKSLPAWLTEMLSQCADDEQKEAFLSGHFYIDTVVDGDEMIVTSTELSARDFYDEIDEAA